MKYFLCIMYFLAPTIATRVGCFQNATFSGISYGVQLNNTIDCHACTCHMLITNFSAVNCYNSGPNKTNCLVFRDYFSTTGVIQLVAEPNGSSACFTRFPPVSTNPSTALITTHSPTTKIEVSTAEPVCARYTQPTVLLQLYNAPNQSYTQYSYVYRATSNKITLMFCFLNQQNFWALDDVSMKDVTNSAELLRDPSFESQSWTYWQPYNSKYYGSGMSPNHNSWRPRTGSYFYLDVQYTAGDGIFQNVTTVVGRNYTISFYLANPRGGNVSVAIVSVGP